MYYFSQGGFYHIEVHGDAILADAVPVTDEEHAALVAGQSEGKIIVADADGCPALADPPAPVLTLAERRAAVAAAVDARRDQHMAEGAEHGGKRFALDGTSRTDLGGMATTGALVLMGALDWPADYATGWIALDNTRLPLPTPQDGIALAAAVAGRYAALVQAARDIKDAVLASDEPEAIDIAEGWPD
ncbi:DUF4376 domain-containing protein [Azospirillum brasilense]|uniref:DUF4376 domain-containing protein n=1 Tax=Azospirillum brasilense TaxID=192 RepID=A0A235HBB2_AZOBR|nr:DUF4376 domain-containing protein [Azospirillum brasilense]OYD82495.1 hypothetical protein CHT98_20050 [Azospirillum brasilense]